MTTATTKTTPAVEVKTTKPAIDLKTLKAANWQSYIKLSI